MIELSIFIFIFLIGVPTYFIVKSTVQKRTKRNFYLTNFPSSWVELLEQKVGYYNKLTKEDKMLFQKRIGIFLSEATISGVGVTIDDPLRLLVASSAVIPVFRFERWRYVNMGEILVYDGEVNTDLSSHEKKDGILLGQVRPFQARHIVLLSKQYLEEGFQIMHTRTNVGIHEFVHLIDQADGSIDGVPNTIMPENLLKPWTKLMYAELDKMKKGKSDINPYGLTNHAEFFAVVSEYFFSNPERFEKHHPELYLILAKTFHQI
jgi:Mlc titration factor MtfA (ptsG expression regulator)